MGTKTLLKIAKVALPILSAGVGIASAWLDNKKMDETVTEKVAEAVAKATNKEA